MPLPSHASGQAPLFPGTRIVIWETKFTIPIYPILLTHPVQAPRKVTRDREEASERTED